LGRAEYPPKIRRWSADQVAGSLAGLHRSRWTRAERRNQRRRWSSRTEDLSYGAVAQVPQKEGLTLRVQLDSDEELGPLGWAREVEDRRAGKRPVCVEIGDRAHASSRVP
jgi:hypothetical protein